MGDLKVAPAVHYDFPLQSFSLYLTFKSEIAALVNLFLRNRGGLVNDPSLLSMHFLGPQLVLTSLHHK